LTARQRGKAHETARQLDPVEQHRNTFHHRSTLSVS
jgi:hypothetical protein